MFWKYNLGEQDTLVELTNNYKSIQKIQKIHLIRELVKSFSNRIPLYQPYNNAIMLQSAERAWIQNLKI